MIAKALLLNNMFIYTFITSLNICFLGPGGITRSASTCALGLQHPLKGFVYSINMFAPLLFNNPGEYNKQPKNYRGLPVP